MSTQAKILANRLNAQKSTGPQTPQGKAVVSQNALKHGLSARHDVITTESEADFDLHRDALLAELDPIGPMESILADRIVSLSWRLKRADLIQNQTIDAMNEKNTINPLANLANSFGLKGLGLLQDETSDSRPDLTLGRIALKDFSNARVLDRLLMYERRIEHSLFKTMLELQRLRLLRTLEPSEPNLEPQDRRLSPGPVPGVGTEPNNTPEPGQNHPTSTIQHPASSIEYPASTIEHPESSIQHPASSIEYPASTIEHPASSIENPASSIENPASSIEYPKSSIIMQNKPNFKMGNINISTATLKAYAKEQRTMNNERHPKQTQSNPKLSPPGRNPALSGVEGTQYAVRNTRYEPCTTAAGQP